MTIHNTCTIQTYNVQGVRYRERGPLKSWRSETMAEAIWAVLQEGLSLSQVILGHDKTKTAAILDAIGTGSLF